MSLKSIDLFSGIGGIAHALHDVAKPVAFCERDPDRRNVLRAHFPGASSVYEDVRNVSERELDDVMTRHGPIDLVAGGWPCFPAGTLVLTDAGYKPIERIHQQLQKVMTHTGAFRRIINRQMTQYTGRIMYIYSELGDTPVACTEDHPFYVRTASASKPVWVQACHLKPGVHYVGLPLTKTYTLLGAREDAPFARMLEEQRHMAHTGHPQGLFGKHVFGGECARGDVLYDEHYCWFRVVDVERSHESFPVFNLEVDVDHSYVVQNMAVSNCKGFSVAGKMNGFDHAESALFKEYARIALYVRPKFIFQENVPEVAKQMDLMTNVFGSQYELRTVILPAFYVGGRHTRKRWFCLGIRRDLAEDDVRHVMSMVESKAFPRVSSTPEPPRMLPVGQDSLSTTQRRQFLSMLGDSVVPACVRAAFTMLLKNETPPADVNVSPDYGFVLDPTAYVSDSPIKTGRVDRILAEPMHYKLWRTPRARNVGASKYLTVRSHKDLYTQVRFERSTQHRHGVMNVQWVCWLMGYPDDWLVSSTENPGSKNIEKET